jgi:hypothetical protein
MLLILQLALIITTALAPPTSASPLQYPLLPTKHTLLSQKTSEYLDAARTKYGIKGVTVTIVKRPESPDGEWKTDYGLFGTANVHDDPVTEDVRTR